MSSSWAVECIFAVTVEISRPDVPLSSVLKLLLGRFREHLAAVTSRVRRPFFFLRRSCCRREACVSSSPQSYPNRTRLLMTQMNDRSSCVGCCSNRSPRAQSSPVQPVSSGPTATFCCPATLLFKSDCRMNLSLDTRLDSYQTDSHCIA